MKFDIKKLLNSLLPSLIAGGLGTVFVILDFVNYDSLNTPFLTPPSYVFGIAWTIVYILCVISTYLFLSLTTDGELKQKGIINYYINMFINLLWTVTFFGLGNLIAALILLVLLYLSTLSMYLTYRKVNKLPSNLLIPYLLWLLLALYLNICIVFLN